MKLLLFAITLVAFSSSAQYKDSLKTFRKLTKSFQKTSDYAFIPSGAYMRGVGDSDMPTSAVNGNYLQGSTMTVDSFFMGKFEISNGKYLEFMADLGKTDPERRKMYLPDTLVWRTPLMFGEKYVDYYFRHPAYRNYPVIGVSYLQAKAYAEWLTEKYNAKEERTFKKVKFRLPTEEEWEYAFKGGHYYSYLPWGTSNTLDEKGKPRANFYALSQLGIYRDSVTREYGGELIKKPAYLSNGAGMSSANESAGSLNESADVTAPVDAYEPNPYGLYQMAGNVEEMVDAYYFRDPNVYSFSHDQLPKSEKPWGVTKGGSWRDTGYYLQYPIRQFYDDVNDSSNEIGFRLVMEVLDY